jgi:hypothetical protein
MRRSTLAACSTLGLEYPMASEMWMASVERLLLELRQRP